MAYSELTQQTASDIAGKLLAYLQDIPGSLVNVQRPAQGYTIISLQPGDGSDWEEIMVDTRGEEPRVSRRTIARN